MAWLPLAEWWYNSNFHTSIGMTSYQALYGVLLSNYGFDHTDSSNKAVSELLRDHSTAIQFLKSKLTKAQERMKWYADKSRTKTEFSVGVLVYLKLHPYKQTLVERQANIWALPGVAENWQGCL